MTERERSMIHFCILDGFEINGSRYRIDKKPVSWDRLRILTKEVRLALDKQEPLIPFHTINQFGLKVWRCGSCESGIDKSMKYCYQCGHKIKWEEDDDE